MMLMRTSTEVTTFPILESTVTMVVVRSVVYARLIQSTTEAGHPSIEPRFKARVTCAHSLSSMSECKISTSFTG